MTGDVQAPSSTFDLGHPVLKTTDRMTLGQWLAVALCAVGFLFDVAEVAFGNVLATIFSAPPHPAAPAQLSILLAAPFAGGVVGAPIFGWIADRSGRRLAISSILACLGVFSIIGFFTQGIGALSLTRVLCGLCLGAYPPVMFAYLADVLPKESRGFIAFAVAAFGAIGAPCGIFFIRWLTPIHPYGIDAWRLALIVYGASAIFSAVAFLGVPESARWLTEVSKRKSGTVSRNAAANSAGLPPDSARHATPLLTFRRIVFALLSFLSPWATSTFPLLSGALLLQKGLHLPQALLYMGISFFGPPIGTLLSGFVVDLIPRKTFLQICLYAMLACGLAFVVSSNLVVVVASSFLFTTLTTLYLPATNIYFGEVHTTLERGRALSSLWAFNRIGAALAPLLLLPLMRASGPMTMFAVIAAALVVSSLLWLTCPSGARRMEIL